MNAPLHPSHTIDQNRGLGRDFKRRYVRYVPMRLAFLNPVPSHSFWASPDGKPGAAAEFQKLLDRSGIVQNSVTGSLVRVQIARAYAMTADTTKAKAAYQDFFQIWKGADPDIPT
jgi:hypothetical protein